MLYKSTPFLLHSLLNTIFTGKVFLEFPVLESTNIYAKNLIANNAPIDGTVITAQHQSAGKGQIGSSWVVEPDKNITLSIIYKPNFLKVGEQFNLSIAVSIGIANYLQSKTDNDVFIKWPNDIYIGNKKIGGILIENTIAGNQISYSVVGIGLNLNQTSFDKSLPNPISLKMITGIEYNVTNEIYELLSFVEVSYLAIKDKHKIQKRIYQQTMLGYQEKRTFIINDSKVEGEILGVNEQGNLLLEINGSIKKFDLRELKMVL